MSDGLYIDFDKLDFKTKFNFFELIDTKSGKDKTNILNELVDKIIK